MIWPVAKTAQIKLLIRWSRVRVPARPPAFSMTELPTEKYQVMMGRDLGRFLPGFLRRSPALVEPTEWYGHGADKKVLSGRQWSPPQRKWLERIGKQLQVETVVDREALNRGWQHNQTDFSEPF